MTAKIQQTMTIEQILSTYPQKAQRLAQALSSAGLNCVGCGAATWETLEVGMRGHGLTDEAISNLLNSLNSILEEQVDTTTITLTPRAAKKFLQILEDENKQGWGLRFAEKMAGCSGFEYALDYSEKPEPNDTIFESQGIQIHVNKDIVDRMMGSEIDYIDALQNSGFKVTNPNVRSACGCGTSHGY